jgi:hypothetical protein
LYAAIDLLLQRFTLGGQGPDLISLLGLTFELIGVRLGIFHYLLRRCACICANLVGLMMSTCDRQREGTPVGWFVSRDGSAGLIS